MAVTYAWRIDANKYSYLNANNNKIDGNNIYTSSSPLAGDKLQEIAEGVELLSLDEYISKFNEMEAEIKNRWGKEVEYLDLLSAEVYYDVDSYDCANLKGIGISGIKHIGQQIKGEIVRTNNRCQPNTIDVYGVFLDDDNKNGSVTPDNLLFVYNGKDASDIDGLATDEELYDLKKYVDETFVTKEEFKSYKQSITTELNSIREAINGINITPEVDNSALLKEIQTLKDAIKDLEEELQKLRNDIDSDGNEGSTSTPGDGGGDNDDEDNLISVPITLNIEGGYESANVTLTYSADRGATYNETLTFTNAKNGDKQYIKHPKGTTVVFNFSSYSTVKLNPGDVDGEISYNGAIQCTFTVNDGVNRTFTVKDKAPEEKNVQLKVILQNDNKVRLTSASISGIEWTKNGTPQSPISFNYGVTTETITAKEGDNLSFNYGNANAKLTGEAKTPNGVWKDLIEPEGKAIITGITSYTVTELGYPDDINIDVKYNGEMPKDEKPEEGGGSTDNDRYEIIFHEMESDDSDIKDGVWETYEGDNTTLRFYLKNLTTEAEKEIFVGEGLTLENISPTIIEISNKELNKINAIGKGTGYLKAIYNKNGIKVDGIFTAKVEESIIETPGDAYINLTIAYSNKSRENDDILISGEEVKNYTGSTYDIIKIIKVSTGTIVQEFTGNTIPVVSDSKSNTVNYVFTVEANTKYSLSIMSSQTYKTELNGALYYVDTKFNFSNGGNYIEVTTKGEEDTIYVSGRYYVDPPWMTTKAPDEYEEPVTPPTAEILTSDINCGYEGMSGTLRVGYKNTDHHSVMPPEWVTISAHSKVTDFTGDYSVVYDIPFEISPNDSTESRSDVISVLYGSGVVGDSITITQSGIPVHEPDITYDLIIEPNISSMYEGENVDLTFYYRTLSDGKEIDRVRKYVADGVVWTTSDSSILAKDSKNPEKLLAVGEGKDAYITAAYNGCEAKMYIDVTPSIVQTNDIVIKLTCYYGIKTTDNNDSGFEGLTYTATGGGIYLTDNETGQQLVSGIGASEITSDGKRSETFTLYTMGKPNHRYSISVDRKTGSVIKDGIEYYGDLEITDVDRNKLTNFTTDGYGTTKELFCTYLIAAPWTAKSSGEHDEPVTPPTPVETKLVALTDNISADYNGGTYTVQVGYKNVNPGQPSYSATWIKPSGTTVSTDASGVYDKIVSYNFIISANTSTNSRNTTITFVNDDGTKSATVSVTQSGTPASTYTFEARTDKDTMEINGEGITMSFYLVATTSDGTRTEQPLFYDDGVEITSIDTSIVMIDPHNEYKLKAVSKGDAEIEVSYREYTDTIYVEVKESTIVQTYCNLTLLITSINFNDYPSYSGYTEATINFNGGEFSFNPDIAGSLSYPTSVSKTKNGSVEIGTINYAKSNTSYALIGAPSVTVTLYDENGNIMNDEEMTASIQSSGTTTTGAASSNNTMYVTVKLK